LADNTHFIQSGEKQALVGSFVHDRQQSIEHPNPTVTPPKSATDKQKLWITRNRSASRCDQFIHPW
jgi:hypothetical protein